LQDWLKLPLNLLSLVLYFLILNLTVAIEIVEEISQVKFVFNLLNIDVLSLCRIVLAYLGAFTQEGLANGGISLDDFFDFIVLELLFFVQPANDLQFHMPVVNNISLTAILIKKRLFSNRKGRLSGTIENLD
jgi:hypothetical protein